MGKLRIGVDFDGVVAKTGELQQYVAKELFGKQIPPTCRSRNAVYEGGLTLEEYKIVSDEACGNSKYLSHLKEQPNAQKTLMNLIKRGFSLEIITAREGKELDFAQRWLKQNEIYVPLKTTLKGENKLFACNGLDVYVEDMPYQIDILRKVVPKILLFNTYDNQESNLIESERKQVNGIEKISNWSQFKIKN